MFDFSYSVYDVRMNLTLKHSTRPLFSLLMLTLAATVK